MGRVKFLYVIRCTSQDPVYQASNLLQIGGSEPWLCAKEDISNQLEAEFQMDKDSHIHSIEIGNCGSDKIEVQVGLSDFPNKTRYITILPTKFLLTAGNQDNSIHVFNRDKLHNVAEAKWNRIKVICSPPHKKKQFGIKYIALRYKESINLNEFGEWIPKQIPHTISVNPNKSFSDDDPADIFDSTMCQVKKKSNAPHIIYLRKEMEQEMNRNIKSYSSPEKFMQLDECQPSTSTINVDCPLCGASFMSSEIERHAATCCDTSAYGFDYEKDYFKCPFCQKLFLGSEINFHADKCLG